MAGRFLPQNLPPLQRAGRLDPMFERYFRSLIDVPQWLGIVQQTDVEAAISANPVVVVGRLQSGIYRVSYYIRVTRAATTSSQLIMRLNWTDGDVPQTQAGANLIGNTTTTLDQDRLMVRVDRDTSITYETAYVSIGAVAMQYAVRVALERLQ